MRCSGGMHVVCEVRTLTFLLKQWCLYFILMKLLLMFEERTLQGETESKPVGSRTDTVARGVQCLIKFIGKPGLNLCQGGPYDLVRKVVYPYAFT